MATIYVDTIADLKNIGSPLSTNIYYVTDPDRGGVFSYDPTSNENDNDGTIFARPGSPTPPPGRYFRFIDGYINVKWFGAKGDNATDDQPPIQKALDYISATMPPSPVLSTWNQWKYGGGTLFFPPGTYIIKSTLLVGQHCRMLGVSKGGDFFPYGAPDNTGSVICCKFEDNNDQWAIDSACRWTSTGVTPGALIEKSTRITGGQVDTFQVTTNPGIVIEGLCIDCSYIKPNQTEPIFGGIRLSAAPNSLIKNVSVLNARVAFMLAACWNTSVEDVYSVSSWYGIVICECNAIKISGSYFVGRKDATPPVSPVPNNPYLNFVYSDYAALNTTAKNGRTGIYISGASNLSIHACAIEKFDNGLFAVWALMTTTSLYIENITNYGVILNGPTQCTLTQSKFVSIHPPAPTPGGPGYAFFIGEGPVVNVNDVALESSVTFLYMDNDAAYRSVQFNQARTTFPKTLLTGKRKYKRDIIFLDEMTEKIYVDPDNGNDERYGFYEEDALKTFDEALVRLQNQDNPPYIKAIHNPIKAIYIKAALPIGGSVTAQTGAATKDISVKSLENVDVLVTSYGVDGSHPKGRIFFLPNAGSTIQVGQIELLGNVNLYFRNVDLICNSASNWATPPPNFSIFGIKAAYSRLSFESHIIGLLGQPAIPTGPFYFLVQANGIKSLVDVKFVNVTVANGYLSPMQAGNMNLGVDCVQINSTKTGGGWQDATIIRNNF